MALVLNSGLPAGSTGLWWFAQGLQNLGTAATGDATLSGAVLSGGQIVHDNTADRTTLSADESLVTGTTAATVMLGLTYTDTTLRTSGCFGVNTGLGTRQGAHHPFADGNTYWDCNGFTEGVDRLVVANAKDTNPHVWGFTFGARGMEIWKDGTKVASNAATPSRVQGGEPYKIGEHGTAASDFFAVDWFFMHTTQLATTLIQDISADPEGELTEIGVPGGGATVTWSANTMLGGGVFR